jgi:DNA primase
MSTDDRMSAAGQPLPGEMAAVAQLNVMAGLFFRSHLPDSWVPPYLRSRGFSPAVQVQWQVGYAPPGWNALTHHLHNLGWADEAIERAGLARRSRRGNLFDVFRDRAMLPVTTPNGTIAGFIGRASEYAPSDVPKYLNSPRTCLYNKSALLFGLYEARRLFAAGASPVLVEGPLDAMAVTTAGDGFFAGVASCGTALSKRHLTALASAADVRSTGALVAFDADPAGQRAAIRAYHLLCPLTEKLEAAEFQPDQDPAGIHAGNGAWNLYDLLARRTHPLGDVVIDHELQRWERWLKYPEGQLNALRAAAPIIAAMPPAHVGRQVARLAIRLGMTHGTVTEAVTDALSERHRMTGPATRKSRSLGARHSRSI